MFLHHFMSLIGSLEELRLHVFAFVALHLRNPVSLFSRTSISTSNIQDLAVCVNSTIGLMPCFLARCLQLYGLWGMRFQSIVVKM